MRSAVAGGPTGLGICGFLDPFVEIHAFRLFALIECNQVGKALQLLDGLRGDRLICVASILTADSDARHKDFWRDLLTRALAAEACLQTATQKQHEDRWRRELAQL